MTQEKVERSSPSVLLVGEEGRANDRFVIWAKKRFSIKFCAFIGKSPIEDP